MKMLRNLLAVALASVAATVAASAATFSVPGTSNPFLAGMPNGSSCCSGDSASGESPVYAGAVTGGATITFTNVSGSVSYAGGTPTDTPIGNPAYVISTLDYEGVTVINGIAGYTNAPIDALIGVFLGSGSPTLTPASTALDFSTGTLNPGLQQVFYIGDGFGYESTSGTTLDFIAPVGATRLYLATVDGFGWYNNSGAINVTVNGVSSAPEPATWAMFLVGFGSMGFMMRGSRRKAAAVTA